MGSHKTCGGRWQCADEVAVDGLWRDGKIRYHSEEYFPGERVWRLLAESKDGLEPDLKLEFLWELLEAWEGWCCHVYCWWGIVVVLRAEKPRSGALLVKRESAKVC